MEFEIFIKDNCFLPETVDIKTNTNVVFRNTDNSKHTIRCKGHAYFPVMPIEAGRSAPFTFDKPGRYEISEVGLGDMKCVIEATEAERENIPKRNYFPTSKDKKFLAEQELLKKKTTELAALLESTPSSAADFPGLLPSMTPETDPESPIQLGNWSKAALGKKKNNHTESSTSDSDGSEDADLRSQRRRFKASSLQYNGKASVKAPGRPVVDTVARDGEPSADKELPPSVRLKLGAQSRADVAVKETESSKQFNWPSGTTVSATVALAQQSTARVVAAVTSAPWSLKHASNSSAGAPSSASQPAVSVTIEDYAFSQTALEVVVGQALHFRLASSVPAHAEHEIVGVSTSKGLCFEAPLMQQDECVAFTFVPTCPGEIDVSCKIYSEMQCRITVTPAPVAEVEDRESGTGGVIAKETLITGTVGAGRGAVSDRTRKKKGKAAAGTELKVPDISSLPASGSPETTVPSSAKLSRADAGSGFPGNAASGMYKASMATEQLAAQPSGPAAAVNRSSTTPARASSNAGAVPSVHTTPSGTVVFTPAGKLSPMTPLSPASPGAASQPSSSATATSVLGSGIRVLDPKVGSPVKNDEDCSDSSQNSFYDSDDIFSDVDVPKTNLARIFSAAEAGRAPHAAAGLYEGVTSDALFSAPDERTHAHISGAGLRNGLTSGTMASAAATSAARPTHTVTVDEYSFHPNHIVIRCGERVHFRQSLVHKSDASLVCEGEFPPSLITSQCVHRESWEEEEYRCFQHVFCNVGKFDVQNEIYVFAKCSVVVVPNSINTDTTAGLRSAGQAGKTTAPALRGSFAPAAPAVPVFHKPIAAPTKTEIPSSGGISAAAAAAAMFSLGPLPVSKPGQPNGRLPPLREVCDMPPGKFPGKPSVLTPTTTTTVTATTTTVATKASAACMDTPAVHSAQRTHSPSSPSQTDGRALGTKADARSNAAPGAAFGKSGLTTPLSESAPRAKPLYGSFPAMPSATSMLQPDVEDYIQKLLSSDLRPAAPVAGKAATSEKVVADLDDSDGEQEVAGGDAAVGKNTLKNRKKKERLKQKLRQKREAEAQAKGEVGAGDGTQEGAEEDDGINESTPLLPKTDGDVSSSGALHAHYGTARSSYLDARADWQQELLDTDDEKNAMDVCSDTEAAPVASAVESIPDVATQQAVHTQQTESVTSAASVATTPVCDTTPEDVTNISDSPVQLPAAVEPELGSPGEAKPVSKRKRKKRSGSKAGVATGQDGEVEAVTADMAAVKVEETEVEVQPTVPAVLTASPETPAARASTPPPSEPVQESPATVPVVPSSAPVPAPAPVAKESPSVLVTPKKVRPSEQRAAGRESPPRVALQTPPTAPARTAPESLSSKRNSSLLRSALKISPSVKDSRPDSIPEEEDAATAGITRLETPGAPVPHAPEHAAVAAEQDEGGQLSLLIAFEQQMEEFFLSRYEAVEALRIKGKGDRLPSGREVEIFYLEDLHLQQVPSSKASRARAQLQQKQEQQHAVERSGSAGSKTSASAPGQPPGQAGGGRGEAGQKKKFSSKRK